MTNRQKAKGDRAERELAKLLTIALGIPIRRMLGAGRIDDVGDLDGIDDTAIQVKHLNSIATAINVGIPQLVRQQHHKRAAHGVLFIKHRRHGWLAVTTLEQWSANELNRLKPLPHKAQKNP